jgi:hypothetical protein
VIKLLLEQGHAIFKDHNGWTSPSWVAEGGHEAVVELLPAKEVNPDLKDKKGRKLLWFTRENKAYVSSTATKITSPSILDTQILRGTMDSGAETRPHKGITLL